MPHTISRCRPGHFSGFFCCLEAGLPTPAADGLLLLAGAGAAAARASAAGAGIGGHGWRGRSEGGRVVEDAGREGDGASKRVVACFSGDMARSSARRALNFFFAVVSL